jgi:hypothetical protein
MDWYQSNGTSNSRGVAIWIKKNVEFKLIDEYKDNEGRLLLIIVEINNASIITHFIIILCGSS